MPYKVEIIPVHMLVLSKGTSSLNIGIIVERWGLVAATGRFVLSLSTEGLCFAHHFLAG